MIFIIVCISWKNKKFFSDNLSSFVDWILVNVSPYYQYILLQMMSRKICW